MAESGVLTPVRSEWRLDPGDQDASHPSVDLPFSCSALLSLRLSPFWGLPFGHLLQMWESVQWGPSSPHYSPKQMDSSNSARKPGEREDQPGLRAPPRPALGLARPCG